MKIAHLFFVTHRHIILNESQRAWPILNRPPLKHVTFLRKWKVKQFLGHEVLRERVFVTELSRNGEMSVWRVVWVKTNFCFMRDILHSVEWWDTWYLTMWQELMYQTVTCLQDLSKPRQNSRTPAWKWNCVSPPQSGNRRHYNGSQGKRKKQEVLWRT